MGEKLLKQIIRNAIKYLLSEGKEIFEICQILDIEMKHYEYLMENR